MGAAGREMQVRTFVEEVWNGKNYAAARAQGCFRRDRHRRVRRTGRAVDEWVVTIMHFDGDRVVREWIGADNLGT